MTGTLVNFITVIIGGTIGCLIKKKLKEEYTNSIYTVLGLAVLIIGINGVVANMFTVNAEGKPESSGELLLVCFLIIGTLIGEITGIDRHFNNVCKKADGKFGKEGFAAGFINGTLVFCTGAMAIIGSINDGINGDSTVLLVKSSLDFVSSIIFGATLGYGVIFSAIPVLVYQGAIAMLAGFLGDFLSGDLLTMICYTGYAIIMAIGINFIVKDKFKPLNMVPAIIMPIIYHYALILINTIKG